MRFLNYSEPFTKKWLAYFYFRSVHTTNDYGVGSKQVLSSVGTNEPVLKVEQYNYTTYDKPVYKVEQYKIQTEGTKTFIPSYTIASNRFYNKIYIIKQNICINIYILSLVGQPDRPIGLIFFVDNYKCYRLKIRIFFFLNTFFQYLFSKFFSIFFSRATPGPSAGFE